MVLSLLEGTHTNPEETNTAFIYKFRGEIYCASLITPVIMEIFYLLHRNREAIPLQYRKIRQFDIRNFFRPEGRTPEERRKKLIKRIALLLSAATATTTLATLGGLGYIGKTINVLSEASTEAGKAANIAFESLKEIADTAPDALVLAGYSLMGGIHSYQIKRAVTQSKFRIIYHAFAACTAFSAIVAMTTSRSELRWHHLSYSLLFMMPHIRILNFFGTVLALDSISYWINPDRDNYDYSNIFQEHLPIFFCEILLLSLIQYQFRERAVQEQNNEEEATDEIPLTSV